MHPVHRRQQRNPRRPVLQGRRPDDPSAEQRARELGHLRQQRGCRPRDEGPARVVGAVRHDDAARVRTRTFRSFRLGIGELWDGSVTLATRTYSDFLFFLVRSCSHFHCHSFLHLLEYLGHVRRIIHGCGEQ